MTGQKDGHQVVAVFGASGIRRHTEEWRRAETCGRLVAEIPLAVATGGYGGAMEAVSAGAASAGGHVIGITAPSVFPERSGANRHVIEEIAAGSITERVHMLVSLSAAAIVLPGSLGTLTEMVAAWNAAFVAAFSAGSPKPVITVGDAWRSAIEHLAGLLSADTAPITSVDSVEEAVASLRKLLAIGT